MEEDEFWQPTDWHEYEADLLGLCAIRAGDFHLLGYREVTADEVWLCVKSALKGQFTLAEVTAKILGLQIGQFMNFMTMNAYKGLLTDNVFDAPKRR